ncbi:MAG: DNA-directed RNA polymerase subunit K [Methanocellales archaeon]
MLIGSIETRERNSPHQFLFLERDYLVEKDKYTRYEKARIIGARALQIAMGAPVLVKTKLDDPIEIAELEFEKGVIPITVKRTTVIKRVHRPVRKIEFVEAVDSVEEEEIE